MLYNACSASTDTVTNDSCLQKELVVSQLTQASTKELSQEGRNLHDVMKRLKQVPQHRPVSLKFWGMSVMFTKQWKWLERKGDYSFFPRTCKLCSLRSATVIALPALVFYSFLKKHFSSSWKFTITATTRLILTFCSQCWASGVPTQCWTSGVPT